MAFFDFFKKGKKPDREPTEPVENIPQMLYAKILFTDAIILDKERIAAELTKEFKNFDQADSEENILLYFFPEYGVQYQDGSVPAQGAIFNFDGSLFDMQSVATALTQSWHWPEASDVISNCKYEFLVSDMMSRGLEYKKRVEYFQKFLLAIIKATKPQAIYFVQSEKLVEPFAYIWAVSEDSDVLNGLVNVRFFNVANSATGEMFVDTLGLHTLGLPDVQIRFREFDPNEIVGLLWGYANYIYENDAVIESGNTIQGLGTDNKWACYYIDSAIEPKRVVMDVESSR